jgi:hypothetical protein
MSQVNNEQVKNEAEKPSGGLVFYPRSYTIVDSIDDSFARGVNQNNEECVVYIRPLESARASASVSGSAKTIPKLLEFAEEGRKARNPCVKSDNNCQATPEGVLMVEQVTLHPELSAIHDGFPVYVGLWASVLREASDMPKVPVGPGYMEIGFSPRVDSEVNEYMTQYKEITGEMDAGVVDNMTDAEEQRVDLYNKIMAGRKKWFTAVMMREKEITTLADVSMEALEAAIKPVLLKYTMKGLYGGVMVRVRSENTVISEFCASCNMQYNYKLKEVDTVENVFENFMKYYGKKILWAARANAYVIDIIPTIRINCGPTGTQTLDNQFKGGGVPKLLKTYVDRDVHNDPMANYIKSKSFLFANIAVRLAVIGNNRIGAGNLLLSSVHAFSAPKGNAFTVGPDGGSPYKMDNEKMPEKTDQAA